MCQQRWWWLSWQTVLMWSLVHGHTLLVNFTHESHFTKGYSLTVNKYIVKIEVQPTYNGFKTVHIAIKLHLWRVDSYYECRKMIWTEMYLNVQKQHAANRQPSVFINLLSVLKLFLKLSTRNQCHFLRMWRQIFPHGNVVTNKSWKTNLPTVQIKSCWTDGGNWIK